MFETITKRVDLSDASLELLLMLGVAFLLGFLFCYVQGSARAQRTRP